MTKAVAKQIFEFELQNIYKEDIHISRVRASCGCTIPSIKKHDLKTWETGAIIAEYNTRSFLGKRGATVTVTIDKPFPAEVQLTVKGYIRSDVTFSPALVQFGDVLRVLVSAVDSCAKEPREQPTQDRRGA